MARRGRQHRPRSRWQRLRQSLYFKALVGLLGLVIVSAAIGVVAPDRGPTEAELIREAQQESGGSSSVATATPTPTSESNYMSTPTPEIGIDEREVEQRFMELLNEERRSRGLQPVRVDSELRAMGESHSRVMAVNNHYEHVEPDGDTIEDRYEQRGLLPECELPIEGSRRFYRGAENINLVNLGRTFVTYNDSTVDIDTEGELATVLFREWMHSEGHREAMLVYSADEAGLGLYITERGEVYASLELC